MAKDRFRVETADNGPLSALIPWSSQFKTTITDRETGKSYVGRSDVNSETATRRAEQELDINRKHR